MHVCMYAIFMLSDCLMMIKIDRNMSEFSWILCKNIILRVVHLLVFICIENELFFTGEYHSIFPAQNP
jgi:hypothetical protein